MLLCVGTWGFPGDVGGPFFCFSFRVLVCSIGYYKDHRRGFLSRWQYGCCVLLGYICPLVCQGTGTVIVNKFIWLVLYGVGKGDWHMVAIWLICGRYVVGTVCGQYVIGKSGTRTSRQ